MKFLQVVILIFSSFYFSRCSESKQPITDTRKAIFEHEISDEQKPWSKTPKASLNNKFTFALFGDLTGGERPHVFDVAVAQLNLLNPDFIMNIGDLIDGDGDIKEINKQWDQFDQRANNAEAPIFYVGGNHDLTGVDLTGVWQNRYGPTYYHFLYQNCLFLVLNSEDYSELRTAEITRIRDEAMARVKVEGFGIFEETEYAKLPELVSGNIGEEQANYFTSVIKAHQNVDHIFVFVHKAPWKNDTEFKSIEEELKGKPYTVFNGHAHTYEHEHRNEMDYIRLATTGGVQFPENGPSFDHVMLVTVDEGEVKIANLKLSGILDKYGKIPLGGDSLCFEKAICSSNF